MNTAQQEAVNYMHGPCLVLAGAVLVMPRGIVGTWQLRMHKRLIQKNAQDLQDEPFHAPEELTYLERPSIKPSSNSEREKVLEVRGLSKNFSGIRALHQVDLDLTRVKSWAFSGRMVQENLPSSMW